MTDHELEEFIKFGEEYIQPSALMLGNGWATKAIEIAKALREQKKKKEWVGLTDVEIADIEDEELTLINTETFSFAKAIEAKLKEKNT